MNSIAGSFHNVNILISNHHVMYFKYVTILFVDFASVKLKKVVLHLKNSDRGINEIILTKMLVTVEAG